MARNGSTSATGTTPTARVWAVRALKAAAVVLALSAVYVLVTFSQVYLASTHDDRGPADAIIVLGAAQYNGRPSPILQARLDHAVELWQQDAGQVIVVTGGKLPGDQFTEAAASFAYLRQRGLPERLILREEQGTNTWEQLAAATRFLRARGLESAVLVSDDYHAYRLAAISDELGFDVAVSPVDPHLSVGGRVKALSRETAAVAVGRVIGFRRLVSLDESIEGVRG